MRRTWMGVRPEIRTRRGLIRWVTAAVLVLPQASAVTPFSQMPAGGVPDGWEPLRFSDVDDTPYELVEYEGQVVLEANSAGTASALVTSVDIELDRTPMLEWSWASDEACFVGDWTDEATDDYPMRLFVLFEARGGLFGWMRKLTPGFDGDAVLYLPDDDAAPDADRASHISGRIRVVPLPVDSGPDGWQRQRRDVEADYEAVFGRAPRGIAGVAVMTDTDNTGTACRTRFGDIRFDERTP